MILLKRLSTHIGVPILGIYGEERRENWSRVERLWNQPAALDTLWIPLTGTSIKTAMKKLIGRIKCLFGIHNWNIGYVDKNHGLTAPCIAICRKCNKRICL